MNYNGAFFFLLFFFWQGKHPQHGTHHAKFTNYSFDVEEFVRLSLKLGEDVQQRKMAAWTIHGRTSNSKHDEL